MDEDQFYLEEIQNKELESVSNLLLDYDDYPEYEIEYTTDW